MQTENKINTQQKSSTLFYLDKIVALQKEKTMHDYVMLIKASKARLDTLYKSAKEKAEFLRNDKGISNTTVQNTSASELKVENEVNASSSSPIKNVDIGQNIFETEEIQPKIDINVEPISVNSKANYQKNQNDRQKGNQIGQNSRNNNRQGNEGNRQNNNQQRNGDNFQNNYRNNDNNRGNQNNQNRQNRQGQNNYNNNRTNNNQSTNNSQLTNDGKREYNPQNRYNNQKNNYANRTSYNSQNNGQYNNQNNRQYNGQNNGNKPFSQYNSAKPITQKVVFADTSLLNNTSKNKFSNSSTKKKFDKSKTEEFAKRKGITKNGLSELDLDSEERFEGKKLKRKDKNSNTQFIKVENAVITTEKVSVKTLSEKIGQTVAAIIKKLIILGNMATINTDIDFVTAELVADEFGVKLEHKVEKSADEKLREQVLNEANEGNDFKRFPIVTVMGHVDHGKTSLLDAIRNTHVSAGEAGGITQHIGAYTIDYNGNKITFIDTPGHEAFTAMRARGASVTDVAILVVSADDGVMPQTKESISQIKQAGVPMVVAINKIDKNDANPEKVKQQLAESGVMPEEWGGDTVMVNISARNNINIDKLLEMVLLVSEVSDLKCNPNRTAIGTVIEAKLDKGKGPVATVLVQNGTLHVGDTIISGLSVGRVRAMMDDKGKNVKIAGPSTPVSVLGLDRVPNAGDKMLCVDDQVAKQVVIDRKDKVQREKQNTRTTMSAEELLQKMQNKKPYNVIVKTDVQGSFEALVHMLNAIENEELQVVCVQGGVGAVNETDIEMAIASNARVIAFNTKTEVNAQSLAEQNKIQIDYYKVIYEVIDNVKDKITALLTPIFEEKIVGHCEVRVLFKISRIGTVAGCYVLDGKIPKNAKITLKRNGETIVQANIVTLQKDKQDVKEVMAGYECGIKLEGFDAIKELDIFEASIMERVARK